MTEFIDQKEFTGPIFEQVEDTIKFLKNHINKAGIIEDVRRKDEYEIPIAALREAVTNAVIHRNYSLTGCDIKVMVFDGSVRIVSPGTLTRSLSVDEIKRGRSEIRNKVIARFMRELNFIEQWGTGIRRMITLCSQQNIPEPEFIETNMAFEVIFKRQLSANYPQLSANYPQLSANELKVLKLLEINTPITKKQVVEYLNVSASTAKLVLSKLKKENIIISEGSSRATSYKLNITR